MFNFRTLLSGKKNKQKHFGRDSVPGQTGTVPGTNRTPPQDTLGQIGLSLCSSTVKSPFCPRLSLGGGSYLGRLFHKGRQKNVYVFSVYWLFSPPTFELSKWSIGAPITHLLRANRAISTGGFGVKKGHLLFRRALCITHLLISHLDFAGEIVGFLSNCFLVSQT